MTQAHHPKHRVLLMILDGWGIGAGDDADAIAAGRPSAIQKLEADFPHAQLQACGRAVGLPEGQMGNSEVGHINIGAGRVVNQDLVRINEACRNGTLLEEPAVAKLFADLKASCRPLHLMGLYSDGGVHASLAHFKALLELARAQGIEKVYVHAFMDGRDTDPKSGKGFISEMNCFMSSLGCGALVSMIGRYYAMDRDKRWERIEKAYRLLIDGIGAPTRDFEAAIEASYREGVTDEFVLPHVLVDGSGAPIGRIHEGDAVVFLNFRNDRAKELTSVLTQAPQAGMTPLTLQFATMTPYDPTFKGLSVLFDKKNVPNTLGEYLAGLGMRQLRIAETEKYAHVTFFFNGGREAPFEGEDRILVPSPKVATYDLKPEMSAEEVADQLIAAMSGEIYDFICLNFANGDMVGHTGVWPAIVKAVQTVDQCVARIREAAQTHGYDIVMIADHGNADHAKNADGSPNTAHSLNPVPIVVASSRVQSIDSGVLADVAPTVLALMGIAQPAEMTGRSLVVLKE